MEFLLLVAFLAYGSRYLTATALPVTATRRLIILAGLLASAMGVQTSTLQRIGNITVRTAFVTGMLADIANESVVFLFWLASNWRTRPDLGLRQRTVDAAHQRSIRRASMLAGIWMAYIAGAVLGGYAGSLWHIDALFIPLGAVVVIATADLRWPMKVSRPVEHD